MTHDPAQPQTPYIVSTRRITELENRLSMANQVADGFKKVLDNNDKIIEKQNKTLRFIIARLEELESAVSHLLECNETDQADAIAKLKELEPGFFIHAFDEPNDPLDGEIR